MRTLSQLVSGFCLTILALSIYGCAPRELRVSLEKSPTYGFTREVDETATRGRLERVTAPEMFVIWRFAVSPDGNSVIYSGRNLGTAEPFQIYRTDIGSNVTVKITSGGDADALDPSFANGGESIVYRTEQSFWKIRKDGSGAKTKIPGSGLNSDYCPQVSSNDRLTYVTYDWVQGKSLIWTSTLDGGEITQYREGNYPSWSPDGSKLVFEYEGDIWTMLTDGTELTQLTSTKEVTEGLPSFSPGGKYIVYASNEGPDGKPSNDVDIWYMRVDGTGKTQVTDLDSWDSWPVWAVNAIYFLSGRAKGDKPVQRIWRVVLSDEKVE